MTMIKKRVAELEGAQLAYAVAVASGYRIDNEELAVWLPQGHPAGPVASFGEHGFRPDLRWDHGGPIIERERIELLSGWKAMIGAEWSWGEVLDAGFTAEGDTPLIAAMRAFVASKLGDEVEVPADHNSEGAD